MKIDRLIGILSILLQKEKVTAPFLAEKFEVSRRTINRDIEDICKAGIPLVTTQGKNGGISIMEGYNIDRTLLTSSDMKAILIGLKSLDSIYETTKYQQLMEKLSVGESSVVSSNQHIVIHLSSWYKSSLAPKIEQVQHAIEQKERIQFTYCSPKEEGIRIIEPYLLLFQWSSWYVWGYCMKREDFRMFKLNRLIDLNGTMEYFKGRELPDVGFEPESLFPIEPNGISIVARMEASIKWRLIDEFGIESIKKEKDGFLLLETQFQDKENLFQWILSYGKQGELLEPKELRKELYDLTEEIQKKYKS